MSSAEEVDALKVPELKAKCKELGLSAVGTKAELAARVKAALAQQSTTNASTAASAVAANSSRPGHTTETHVPEAPQGNSKPAVVGAAAGSGNTMRSVITFNEALATKGVGKLEVVCTAPKAEPAKGPVMSEAERLKRRAERFKDPAAEKLKERAERFGLPHPDLAASKLKERALKFGLLHPEIEMEKRKQRAERFGIVDEETKKRQRLEKFKPFPSTTAPLSPRANGTASAATSEVDKLGARALRFGL